MYDKLFDHINLHLQQWMQHNSYYRRRSDIKPERYYSLKKDSDNIVDRILATTNLENNIS